MQPLESRHVGPFELVRQLGAGGMAETFLAVRHGPAGFEQRVCLKRILPAYASDSEFVRLFLDEARIAARLRHATIVQVLGFDFAEGSHYLILELVEGIDLRELIRHKTQKNEGLTTGLVSYLATELGTALHIAHTASRGGVIEPIVHRDVSPSNVLLSYQGEVKLADFGIARALNSAESGQTIAGKIKGKFPYMAPEYSSQGKFDARSDLFALGVVLYECIAGRRPFDGNGAPETMRRIAEGAHDHLSEIAPSTPQGLIDAIERLILPDPEKRFQSAAELLDALIEVAPPPTARRICGDAVTEVRKRRTLLPSDGIEMDPVVAAHVAASMTRDEDHTSAIDAETFVALPVASGPSDRTRTVASVIVDFGASRSVGGETQTSIQTSILPSDQAAPSVDSVHEMKTRMIQEGAEFPTVPPRTTEVPRESTAPATLVAQRERLSRDGGDGTKRARVAVLGMLGVVAVVGGIAAMFAIAQPGRWLGADTPVASAPPLSPPTQEAIPQENADETAPSSPSAIAVQDAGVTAVVVPSSESASAVPEEAAADRDIDEVAVRSAAEFERSRPAGPRGHASITVVVFPHGDVWIDGHRVGPSPWGGEVSEGRHVLSAGDGRPTFRRAVTLADGDEKHFVLP